MTYTGSTCTYQCLFDKDISYLKKLFPVDFSNHSRYLLKGNSLEIETTKRSLSLLTINNYIYDQNLFSCCVCGNAFIPSTIISPLDVKQERIVCLGSQFIAILSPQNFEGRVTVRCTTKNDSITSNKRQACVLINDNRTWN